MKTSWTPIKTAISVALCGAALFTSPAFAQSAPVSVPEAQANMALLPGDDFFTFANREWLDKTEIPADRSSWGAFAAIAEDTNQRIVKMFEKRHLFIVFL